MSSLPQVWQRGVWWATFEAAFDRSGAWLSRDDLVQWYSVLWSFAGLLVFVWSSVQVFGIQGAAPSVSGPAALCRDVRILGLLQQSLVRLAVGTHCRHVHRSYTAVGGSASPPLSPNAFVSLRKEKRWRHERCVIGLLQFCILIVRDAVPVKAARRQGPYPHHECALLVGSGSSVIYSNLQC